MDSLSQYIAAQKDMNRPLSVSEAMKFLKQAIFEGDTANYIMPNTSDFMIMSSYFKFKKDTTKKGISSLINSFTDTSNQVTRMSINMADVGTVRLPQMIAGIKQRSDELFDKKKYNVIFTGSSITFLEGSKYIVDGLKQSILWAFLLIALCMLYLFKSLRILFCSLIPNVIPLIVTAGIMGWVGIRLKPSTVLIFSVALGIAIDVTIRFLVNYKQELPRHNNDVIKTVGETINHTGLSILYTSMVLIAGFIIFCFSGFGGTQALGWLTSLTLLVATLTNLILLPVLLLTGSTTAVKPPSTV
jgi:predicted RND superfamily exporter protein